VHYLANRFLDLLSNMCTNLNLTGMHSCCKILRREVTQGIIRKSDRFDFEPELTANVARFPLSTATKQPPRRCWIYEIPVSYCQPTTHRAVRSVSCPPPHHPQECRPEPPFSARVGGGSVPPQPSGGIAQDCSTAPRGRPPWHAFLPAICWILRGASSIGSPTPSAGRARKHGSPSAASSIRLRLGIQRCAVGPRRQKLRDALSLRTQACCSEHRHQAARNSRDPRLGRGRSLN